MSIRFHCVDYKPKSYLFGLSFPPESASLHQSVKGRRTSTHVSFSYTCKCNL